MATELVFRDDPYARDCTARVVHTGPDGIVLDRTVFYAAGGGQPGDTGTLVLPDGAILDIVDTVKAEDGETVVHLPADGAALPAVGDAVTARLDWDRRHLHMRMHTAMHLLCAAVEGDVTGGQIGAEKSRLDFNIPAGAVDKEALAEKLNTLVAADAPITTRWIEAAELEARPELVRTMSVKPPTTGGRVRLVEIEGIDLQPCGGTHVARTGEIGRIVVGKIENKGRQNRRIAITLGPAA